MSLVAAVKGLGQSETLGLAASLFIFLSWSHLFLSPLFASHTDTHTLALFLLLNQSPLQGRWRGPFAIQ